MHQAKGKLIGKRGLRLTYGQWYPQGEAKAVVVLAHGYAEHMGRYRHVTEALTEQGYIVFAMDHRGHGESEGERAWVEKFDYFIEDLHLLVLEAKGAHRTLPLFLLGHSMGGLIATRYALRYQELLDGLILSGAAIQVGDDVPPALKRVSSFLSQVAPKLPVLDKAQNVLSRDPEVERRFSNDPLCYNGKVKARLGYEMMVASQEVRTRLEQLTLPLLVMHGSADRLTTPAGSQLLYERATSPDKTLHLWPDYYHEIFNEVEKEHVIAYLLDWLEAHVRHEQATQQTEPVSTLHEA